MGGSIIGLCSAFFSGLRMFGSVPTKLEASPLLLLTSLEDIVDAAASPKVVSWICPGNDGPASASASLPLVPALAECRFGCLAAVDAEGDGTSLDPTGRFSMAAVDPLLLEVELEV